MEEQRIEFFVITYSVNDGSFSMVPWTENISLDDAKNEEEAIEVFKSRHKDGLDKIIIGNCSKQRFK